MVGAHPRRDRSLAFRKSGLRMVTAARRDRRARFADMSASFVVGLAIRSAPEWVICAARRAADRASCRSVVPEAARALWVG